MKLMIISDIHGGIDNLNTCLEIFNKEQYDKLLILGDLFNYGIDYNRTEIIEKLNSFSDNIIAVRGNCDININEIIFNMPSIQEINLNNKKIVMSHGDLYTENDLLKSDNDIILVGHSHKSKIEKVNNKIIINPGSITKSRDKCNSFGVIFDNKIYIKNLNNEIINEYNI